MKNLGIYIHIPFCKSRCRYCDFCSFPNQKSGIVEDYVSALISEIKNKGKSVAHRKADTVYFGGGTPTVLKPHMWRSIVDALHSSFNIDVNAEITAECNPAMVNEEYLRGLVSLGINRLSIGAQSMEDDELKLLGRLHTKNDVLRAFEDAKNAGFSNVSADVMYGIPLQTAESLANTLNAICNLNPSHISLYGLKIEEGTYFYKHKNELSLPDEDTEYEMYISSSELLAKRGFKKYEISNFAQAGFESRHNLKYWRREDYLGLGLSAHSFMEDRRFHATCQMENYLSGKINEGEEIIPPHDALCEEIMLSMRLSEGCDFSVLEKKFGKNVLKYEKALRSFAEGGQVLKSGRVLSFSDKGMYVSNYILSEVLDFEP